jgi:hypothetical protein
MAVHNEELVVDEAQGLVYFSASKHAPLEKHYYVAAFAHLLTPLLLVKLSRHSV